MAPTIEDLLTRNESTLPTHTPIPKLPDLAAAGKPVSKTLIVTCMDPRCIPEQFFSLSVGEVGVVRNGGGNVRHALRDIAVMDHFFGLEQLAIVHHTDCGTLSFSEEQVRARLKGRVGEEYWGEVDRMVFGANPWGLEESVRREVEWVRAHPLISERVKKGVQGYVFDLETGRVERVEV